LGKTTEQLAGLARVYTNRIFRGMRGTEDELASLKLEQLRKEVEKLGLEIKALKSTASWDRVVGRYLPIVTSLVAVGGFWFGLWQYSQQKSEGAKQQALGLRQDAAKPFWETQLGLYIKAADAAATIATARDPSTRSNAETTFWTLYWGPLSCVEDITLETNVEANVEAAMVVFGNLLQSGDSNQLTTAALGIAHAIRNEIGPVFNVRPAKLRRAEQLLSGPKSPP
jgi:hypothetical protein